MMSASFVPWRAANCKKRRARLPSQENAQLNGLFQRGERRVAEAAGQMMARLDQSEKTSAADSDGTGCFIAIALYGDTLRTVADKEELPTFC